MFRSYEFSLAMRRSQASCPAQSPEPVLPNVTSPGSLGTQYIYFIAGDVAHICGVAVVYQALCGACYCYLFNPHNKPTKQVLKSLSLTVSCRA